MTMTTAAAMPNTTDFQFHLEESGHNFFAREFVADHLNHFNATANSFDPPTSSEIFKGNCHICISANLQSKTNSKEKAHMTEFLQNFCVFNRCCIVSGTPGSVNCGNQRDVQKSNKNLMVETFFP